jgi:chemotaxis protein CheX
MRLATDATQLKTRLDGMTMLANARTYRLTEVLDLKAALPLAEGLLALRGLELMIDASRVERLGAQSLQILLSAVSTWHADGVAIEFVQPSVPFIRGLELLGIDPECFLTGGHVQGLVDIGAD